LVKHPNRCLTFFMLKTRTLLLLCLLILFVSWFSASRIWKRSKTKFFGHEPKSYSLPNPTTKKIKSKAPEAKLFIEKNNYNTSVCFLLDMSLPAGQNRFFIYDMKKDSIQKSGLVAHGNCFQYCLEGRKYSNVVGSGCTSLGKYKVGNSYTGKFGYSYKLHGLDSTNNNAFERTVVLHSHSCIPETEVSDDICQSNGCPTVSPEFLKELKTIINKSKKPVLLWIYE
jgi:hypothetical protein